MAFFLLPGFLSLYFLKAMLAFFCLRLSTRFLSIRALGFTESTSMACRLLVNEIKI